RGDEGGAAEEFVGAGHGTSRSGLGRSDSHRGVVGSSHTHAWGEESSVSDATGMDGAGLFAGVRVVEVATWQFVPGAAALMADLGADVIKVENTTTGDPQRGMTGGGRGPPGGGPGPPGGQGNRRQRRLGLDPRPPRGGPRRP